MKLRKALLCLVILGLISSGTFLLADSTRTKSIIGRQDLKGWDGKTETFTRRTSTGGTYTLLKVGNTVDVLTLYGDGTDRSQVSINTAISNFTSAENATLELAPGSWALSDDVTIPSNLTLSIPNGAVVTIASGKALTINGKFTAGRYKVFVDNSGGIGVVFGQGAVEECYPEWWDVDGTADEVQINQAIQSMTRGVVKLLPTQYTLADPVVMKEIVYLEGSGGSHNYGNEGDPYVTTLYQGDVSKDGVQVGNGASTIFSTWQISDLDIKGNSGTGSGLAIVGAAAGNGSVQGGVVKNVTVYGFSGTGGVGIYQDGTVFRLGYYSVTCHNNKVNFLSEDGTYSGTPSDISFYNCSFRCQNADYSTGDGYDYNWINTSGGGLWGFYNCDFSKAQNAAGTAIGFYQSGQGTSINCNFEHNDVGAFIDAQGYNLIGCTANDSGTSGYQLSASKINMIGCTSTSATADDITIDAGANGCSIDMNLAGSSLTITDSGNKTTYPNKMIVDDDGSIGRDDERSPRIYGDLFNTEFQTVTSTSSHVAIDMENGGIVRHTLTEDTTIDNPTNPAVGDMLSLRVIQAAGSFTYQFGDAYRVNVSEPVSVSTGNYSDTWIFIYLGTSWFQFSYNSDIEP